MLVTAAATAVVVHATMKAVFGQRMQQVSSRQVKPLLPVSRGVLRVGMCVCCWKKRDFFII